MKSADYAALVKEAHRERDELLKKLYESQKKESSHEILRFSEKQLNALQKSYDLALKRIAMQKLSINELTVEISRSFKTNDTTTRDDGYFENLFAGLEGAIRQWVCRSSPSWRRLSHDSLSPTIRDSLKAIIFDYKASVHSTLRAKEIEGAIFERLHTRVFNPSFLLTIQEERYDIEHISKALRGTCLKKREWHARTVGMILEEHHNDDNLCRNIIAVEKDLQDCFSFMPKGNGEEQRRKSLLAIIKQAAKIQLEIFRQVSFFEISHIKPGALYDPQIMDDISSLVDEDEAGTQVFIVRVVVFPPILRWGFGEDGNYSTNVVVRKGTVVTIRS